ncbi:MAG: hypothetical protein JAY75_15085, partial [Candidatus Thiodiazotropha taylori]|nr:hypothetical protein [Candidatus Thiodiazotropha taylori]MCW4309540.1 hypothetical protein [Candidatus Thiodiazotropha endolucinida]
CFIPHQVLNVTFSSSSLDTVLSQYLTIMTGLWCGGIYHKKEKKKKKKKQINISEFVITSPAVKTIYKKSSGAGNPYLTPAQP